MIKIQYLINNFFKKLAEGEIKPTKIEFIGDEKKDTSNDSAIDTCRSLMTKIEFCKQDKILNKQSPSKQFENIIHRLKQYVNAYEDYPSKNLSFTLTDVLAKAGVLRDRYCVHLKSLVEKCLEENEENEWIQTHYGQMKDMINKLLQFTEDDYIKGLSKKPGEKEVPLLGERAYAKFD